MATQEILVTWPELWHNIYEAHFDPNNFWDFRQRVSEVISVNVTPEEINHLWSCDYTEFCYRIKSLVEKDSNNSTMIA